MTADLIVYAHGVNDAAGQGASTDLVYLENVQNALNKWRAGSTTTNSSETMGAVDFLVIAPHIGTWDTTGPSYYAMISRARALCEQYGAGFISVGTQFRNSWWYAKTFNFWSTGAGFSGAPGTDGVHPGDIGNALMANLIIPYLNTTV